jgi:hypothetical protein
VIIFGVASNRRMRMLNILTRLNIIIESPGYLYYAETQSKSSPGLPPED